LNPQPYCRELAALQLSYPIPNGRFDFRQQWLWGWGVIGGEWWLWMLWRVRGRGGTQGFRAPEVLLGSHCQTCLIDIWSTGHSHSIVELTPPCAYASTVMRDSERHSFAQHQDKNFSLFEPP
jgi:hypothetical protein